MTQHPPSPSPPSPAADLERIEAYLQGVTPGPWAVDRTHALGAYGVWTGYATHPGHDGAGYCTKVCSMEPTVLERKARDADAAFIANARTDLPLLVAHCRALLDELLRIKESPESPDWLPPDCYSGEFDEPVGSCDNCGSDYWEDEDDGSGLCDQCQWWASQ